MSRRRRREGTGAVVREIRAQGDRIVAAIRQVGADAGASRVAMVKVGAEILRTALGDASRRGAVVDLETGETVQLTANDVEPPGDGPPESGRR